MTKLALTLETVTPMFLGGAQQEAELRPASVRGALRYWLRAALGGCLGDTEEALECIRRLEAGVFGNTERASAVMVSCKPREIETVDAPLLPHRPDGANAQALVNSSFDLMLSLRPIARPQLLEIATWSALIWLTLGGLGRRSRRGAGSLRLKQSSDVACCDFFTDPLKACLAAAATKPRHGQELADRIGNLLEEAIKAFAHFASASTPSFVQSLPAFSVLNPNYTRVVVCQPPDNELTDYTTALDGLMSRMSGLKRDLGETAFSEAFGGITRRRRASPLHVTAHRMEHKWALVLTHLKAQIQHGTDGRPGEVAKFLESPAQKWSAYPRVALDD